MRTNISVFFLMITFVANAQPKFEILKIEDTPLEEFVSIDEYSGWLYFSKESKFPAENFFSEHKTTFSLSTDDVMQLTSKIEDPDLPGYVHYRYKQFYKNIEVERSSYMLHAKEGNIYVANGKVVPGLNFNNEDTISETEALNNAIEGVNAIKYAWEDSSWENEIKNSSGNENATYFPKGILKFTQIVPDDWTKQNYKLAYYFEINTLIPSGSLGVYINAETGEILKQQSLASNDVCTIGTVNTVYDGNNISFNTMYRSSYNDYILQDECRGGTFTVKNYTGASWIVAPKIYQPTNSWGYANAQATCLWGIEEAWDYFKYVHNRNGISNGNRDIHVWHQSNFNDASYQKKIGYDEITVGPGFETLDVLAHEFTHGVTAFTSELDKGNTEAAALNESYSDIFGVLVEDYTKGGLDWGYGNNFGSTDYRNLNDPFTSYVPQPKSWMGTNWDTNGEPHINGGVNNYWFYLLTVGGSGSHVLGIGKAKSRFIAFKTLTLYLTDNSNYSDARAASRQATIDNYGACSNEVAQLCAAWDAVNVPGTGYTYCCTVTGAQVLCDDESDLPFTYTVLTRYGSSYNWTIPSGFTPSSNASTNSSYTLTSFSSTTPKTIQVTSSRAGSTATCSINISIIDCEPDCPPICRVENDQHAEISLFPVPASDFVTLRTSEKFLGHEVAIIDLLGRVRNKFIITDVNMKFEILGLKSGYYLSIISLENTKTIIPFTIFRD